MGPELFHRALYHRIVSYVFALYNRNPKFMSITKWYKKDSYGVVNGISVSESLWRELPDLYWAHNRHCLLNVVAVAPQTEESTSSHLQIVVVQRLG